MQKNNKNLKCFYLIFFQIKRKFTYLYINNILFIWAQHYRYIHIGSPYNIVYDYGQIDIINIKVFVKCIIRIQAFDF